MLVLSMKVGEAIAIGFDIPDIPVVAGDKGPETSVKAKEEAELQLPLSDQSSLWERIQRLQANA